LLSNCRVLFAGCILVFETFLFKLSTHHGFCTVSFLNVSAASRRFKQPHSFFFPFPRCSLSRRNFPPPRLVVLYEGWLVVHRSCVGSPGRTYFLLFILPHPRSVSCPRFNRFLFAPVLIFHLFFSPDNCPTPLWETFSPFFCSLFFFHTSHLVRDADCPP